MFMPWQVAAPFFFFVLHACLFRAWLIDDAGISFAYARNLAHGCGLVSQCGVAPVEGFSNPLWTFLLAPLFIHAPMDPTPLIKGVSLLLVLGTFLLVNSIGRLLAGSSWWSKPFTLVVLTFLSINTSFVAWTTSGLENPLYAFFSALYGFFTVKYASDDTARHGRVAVWAGCSAAALALTRPDGVIFFAAFPLALAIRMLNVPSPWRREARGLAAFLAAASLPLAVYLVFRMSYFGDYYPNTYYAKRGPTAKDLLQFLMLSKHYTDNALELLHSVFSRYTGPILLLFLAASLRLLLVRRKTAPAVFLLPALACSWAIYCLLPGDWMAEYRFATPFLVFFPIVLLAMVADILDTPRLSLRSRKIGFFVVAIAFLAQSAVEYIPRSLRFARNPTVPFELVTRKYAVRFNNYAQELHLQDASLLCPDLGGTLYFSQLRIYDLSGLCDRALAPLINSRSAAFSTYVLTDLRPTFIHTHDIWSVRSGLFRDPRFKTLYAVIQEQPSELAGKLGHKGIFSGDYVRKDALNSEEDLERLRRRLLEDPLESTPGTKGPLPFPRG